MWLGSKHRSRLIRVLPSRWPGAGLHGQRGPSGGHGGARSGGAIIAVWLDLDRYLRHLGIDHILRGIDHLLFVLGLIWLVRRGWMLVHTITAFTVGHSLSLASATFGWVGVPERPLNAAIALSIVSSE